MLSTYVKDNLHRPTATVLLLNTITRELTRFCRVVLSLHHSIHPSYTRNAHLRMFVKNIVRSKQKNCKQRLVIVSSAGNSTLISVKMAIYSSQDVVLPVLTGILAFVFTVYVVHKRSKRPNSDGIKKVPGNHSYIIQYTHL